MKSFPVVSIVGRQNVGKSTLFNCILKKQLAITHDFPGVTRDVLSTIVRREELKSKITLCDTPGLDIENADELTSAIIEQAFNQLLSSDIIIFVMAKNELTEYDRKLIELFRKDKRFADIDIIYCINKSDSADDDFDLENYFRLGLQEVIPVSALGRRNVKLLIEKINFYLPQGLEETETISDFRISIVGKPNSGKSSLLNAILGFTRSIVSNIPGTTRDSVNSIAKYKDKNIEIIDTAGIRKASKTGDSIEFYSYSRTLKSIESSDIVVLIIDATKGIGEFDKKIFGHIREKGKPIVFAVNKWDLVPEKDSKSFDEYKKDMIDRFFPVQSFPVISISAKENQRVRKVLDECIRLFEKSRTKVPTSDLNGRLREWMDEGKFNSQAKKSPKLLYATQISTSPFKVLFFVNDVSIFKPSMLAYLKKKLVDSYELEGMQIDIELRSDREKHRERKKK